MTQRIVPVRQHPKIPVYQNNGGGRDTYISLYNGGFGKYNINDTYFKEITESPKHIYHQNLSLCKPTKRYFTNGGGRDTYVYNSLLDENDKCKGNLLLNNILRSYDVTKYPIPTSKDLSPSKFEKKLINRIFYGKSYDVKDRQMSPKVKFLKKEDIQKNREENSLISFEAENENEKNNNTISATKMDKSFEVGDRKFNKYETIGYNASMTEGNTDTIKNTSEMDFNNSLFNLKKSPRKYKPEFIQNDNLVDSVKKIFLYNSKNKHLYNNIKIADLKQKSAVKEPLV
jgi:hypothetical protein